MEFENQVKSVKRITMPHKVHAIDTPSAVPYLHISFFGEFVPHKPMNNFKKAR